MSETDLEFYARRKNEEMRAAKNAVSPEAASAHRVLAEIYTNEVKRLCMVMPGFHWAPSGLSHVRFDDQA